MVRGAAIGGNASHSEALRILVRDVNSGSNSLTTS
ncbi:Uncharacterised protein [Mycobacterium tuberculosis]|nr:Uncharacterised protein [Mycobacterium tuberculosis]